MHVRSRVPVQAAVPHVELFDNELGRGEYLLLSLLLLDMCLPLHIRWIREVRIKDGLGGRRQKCKSIEFAPA